METDTSEADRQKSVLSFGCSRLARLKRNFSSGGFTRMNRLGFDNSQWEWGGAGRQELGDISKQIADITNTATEREHLKK